MTLYASGDSDPALGVTPILPRSARLQLTEAAKADPSMVAEPFLAEHHAYLQAMLDLAGSDVDLVHNHSLHYLPIAMAPTLSCPLLTTLHTPPTPWLESAMATLPPGSGASFVSVSAANAQAWTATPVHGVVHNGIPTDEWPFLATPDDHLVWMGRLVPEKAPHLAIEAARLAGLPLLLAGPVGDADYVAGEITPRLGGAIRHVGHLDTDALAQLVGRARACLVTPDWEEPYGLVVTEALSCGTPVLGFARGALPELVDDTCGRLVAARDVAGLAAATADIDAIDRSACRERALTIGSLEAMTDRYEQLYAELVG